MKDILIKGTTVKRELVFWIISLAAAVLVNIYSIIKYNTQWIELLSQIHIVIALSILIYLILLAVRSIVKFLRKSAK
jgi:hypothetical protein